jgi:nitrogen fixation/metabolism regulation signal transduction histidine kinase
VSRFRKSKAAVLRSIQLHDFLDECLADARLPHKGISPDLRVDPTEQALLDPLLVRVGLDNILTNIKQQSQHVTKVVVTASTFSAGGVRIRVQDNGRGFPPDVLSEFDALYHGGVLTAPAETLGLGLVIAKSVMDIHGGQLRIGNDADHGGWVEMLFLGGGSKAEERGAR